MKTISQLDANFKVEKQVDLPDARFFNIKKNPRFYFFMAQTLYPILKELLSSC